MSLKSGFMANGLIHINRVDRGEPFCPCHDDPWALCEKWAEWGVTPEERKAALAAEVEVLAALFAVDADDLSPVDTSLPEVSHQTQDKD